MFVLCLVILLSVGARYYREEVGGDMLGDPVVEKVMELQNKFNVRKDEGEPEEPEEKPKKEKKEPTPP